MVNLSALEKNIILERINKNFSEIPSIFHCFKLRLNFSNTDIIQIIYKCPEIASLNINELENNILRLKSFLNLKTSNIKLLFLKYPILLTIKPSDLIYKINLLSRIFAICKTKALQVLFTHQFFLTLDKDKIIKQVIEISNKLDAYGLTVRKMFKMQPLLVFADLSNIDKIKKLLMRKYTLSEPEVNNLIKTNPNLLLEKIEVLDGKLKVYYPEMFVKRDIKEMLSTCPEFICVSPDFVASKASELSKFFNLSLKKAYEFIRTQPNIVFNNSLSNKVLTYDKLNLNMEYIKFYPFITNCTDVAIKLKFILTRCLGIDDLFNDICKMDTNLFISRFIYMQNIKKFSYRDLILSDDAFKTKYNISSNNIVKAFKPSIKIIKNIYKFYISLNNKLNKWSFIDLNINETYAYLSNEKLQAFNCYSNSLASEYISKNMFNKISVLKNLSLSNTEIKFILLKQSVLSSPLCSSLKENILILKKYNLSNEEIIKYLFNKPSLFCYDSGDLEKLIKQVVCLESCTIKEAIEKFI